MCFQCQQSTQWLKHSQPCLHQLNVLRMVFPGSHFLRLAFGLCFYPISLPPLYFPLIISVTGAWFHWRGGQWLESIGLPAMGV